MRDEEKTDKPAVGMVVQWVKLPLGKLQWDAISECREVSPASAMIRLPVNDPGKQEMMVHIFGFLSFVFCFVVSDPDGVLGSGLHLFPTLIVTSPWGMKQCVEIISVSLTL